MKIFLVDKDPSLASALAALIQQAGYPQVDRASTCEEARNRIVAAGGTDLLVTDVIMEGMDGFALRESLGEIFPALKTIFLSEYDLTDYEERIAGAPVFYKPFEASTLIDYIKTWCPPPVVAPAAPAVKATPAPVAIAATPALVPAAPAVKATPSPVATPAPAAPAPAVKANPAPVAVAATPAPVAAAPAVKATPSPVATPAPAAPAPAVKATPAPVAVAATPAPVAAAPAVKATPSPVATPAPAAPAPAVTSTPAPVTVAATSATVAATPAVKAAPATAAVKATPAAVAVKAAPAHGKAAPLAAKVPVGAKPGAPAAAAAAAIPDVEFPPDDLVGTKVGDYLIEAKIGETSFAGIYRAVQEKMGRKVRFYALNTKNNPPPEQIEKFRQDAVLKAKVQQSFILAVYEAGESDGVLYYSTEYLPGRTLEQTAQAGQKIDGPTALAILRTATDAFQNMEQNGIPHLPVSSRSILITGPAQVRIANIAAVSAEQDNPAQDRQTLGSLLQPLLQPAAEQAVPGLTALLGSLAAGGPESASWDALRQSVAAVTPKSRIADAAKLEAKEMVRRKLLQETKQKQRKSVLLTGLTSFGLLAIGFAVLYWVLFLRGSAYKTYDAMIEIPAGPFIYQDGETLDLPTFWISEHPVTIGQYAEFLAWLRNNPDRIDEIRHPDAPSGKDFIPQDWADSETIDNMPGYYTRARRWGRYRGAALNLDSPVFGVDFYDAWAYAKWRGMRLPTEQEWEKAARGTEGFLYPWGNEPQPEWANTGADFDPNPEKGGDKDGWKRWSPVDAMRRDRSVFGVMGMAGNVSEWTDSFDESPHLGMKVPVIRGGNYQNPDASLTRRLLLRMAIQNDEVLGFRLASSVPPDQVTPLE